VLLHVSIEDATALIPPRVGTLEAVDAHTCRLRVEVDSLEWFAMRVAVLDVDFTVESPPALRDVVTKLGARMRSAAR
jgi:predicted DNA-binding transcriptional regulator YafY